MSEPEPIRPGTKRWRRFPFEVIRPVGKGAMGSVFEVRLADDPRRLAAKILTQQSAHARERFRREGELMSRLRHPGIVSLHAAGVLDDGHPYLLFDLVQGESLHEWLARAGQLDEATALELGAHLADALHHAHQAGIVHRDVKPSNVLIDASDRRPRLTDFGIALAADQERLTRTGAWAGTPLYMAPEQLTQGTIGPHTDVYALGAVLFQALAGRPPFEEERGTPLITQVLGAIPPDLRSLRPEVSRATASIVARCLEKEPTLRYPHAQALADDLRAAGRGESLSGSNVRLMRRSLRRAVAGRWAKGIALALLLGAAGGVVSGLGSRRSRSGALTSLAGDLDGARVALRQSEAGEDEQARAERLLLEAGEALESAAAGPARQALVAARASLARVQGQRAALSLLGSGGALDRTEALEALVEAFLAVPSAGEEFREDRAERRFEDERGRVLFTGGRWEEAERSLRFSTQAARSGALARGGSQHLLAWVALRRGRQGEARRLLEEAHPTLRAELALARGWLAGEDAGQEVRAALGDTRGHDVQLLLCWSEAQRLGEEAEAQARWDVLQRARKISDPAAPASIDAVQRALASLLEGELCAGLGWWASSAEAFQRARRSLPAGQATPLVGITAHLPGAPVALLLGPWHAAHLGEALARRHLLAPLAAVQTAEEATAWGRNSGDPAAAWVAELVLAEALSADSRSDEARAALERARVLGPTAAAVRVIEAHLGRRTGARQAGLDLDGGALLLADAEAELQARLESRQPSPALLARARRGYLLAVGGPQAVAGRAWSGLSRIDMAKGDYESALQAAQLAGELAPDDWVVLLVRGLARVGVKDAKGGQEDLNRAIERLSESGGRPLEVATQLQWLLRQIGGTLAGAGDASGAGACWRMAARRAEESRLPGPYQVALLDAAIQLAARARDAKLLQALRLSRGRAQALADAHQKLYDKVREQWQRPDLDTTAEELAVEALVAQSPAMGRAYSHRWGLQLRMRPEGYHDLALSYELTPLDAIDHMEDMRDGIIHASLVEVLPGFAASEPVVDESLSLAADRDLQIAVMVLMGKLGKVELPPESWFRGLAAAERYWVRRPRTLAAALALGLMRLELGDAAGAVRPLEIASFLLPPFEGRNKFHHDVVQSYLAQAWGALRDWGQVATALEAVTRVDPTLEDLRRDPRLWEDRNLSGSVHPALTARLKKLQQDVR